MASMAASKPYKQGSLAAIRAERAAKKQQIEAKNNVLMPSPCMDTDKEIGSEQHRSKIRKQSERIHKWQHMLTHWSRGVHRAWGSSRRCC